MKEDRLYGCIETKLDISDSSDINWNNVNTLDITSIEEIKRSQLSIFSL